MLKDRAFIYLRAGFLRGIVGRAMGSTISMSIEASANERARLAAHILWLEKRATFHLTDSRSFPRYTPKNPHTFLTLPDGTQANCTILNLSPTGAAVLSELRPELRSKLLLGQIQGEIARHMESGFACGKSVVQDPCLLESLLQPQVTSDERADDKGFGLPAGDVAGSREADVPILRVPEILAYLGPVHGVHAKSVGLHLLHLKALSERRTIFGPRITIPYGSPGMHTLASAKLTRRTGVQQRCIWR